MSDHSSIFAEGARRVWRRQRIVWWIFLVNLVLGLGSALPLSHRIGDVTDHSLAAQRLVNGFDYGTYSELLTTPNVNFGARFPESTVAVLVFFVFMLFMTGGILASFVNDYKLRTHDFFANCGAFFWRWVRLLMFMLIVVVPIGYGGNALMRWAEALANDAAWEKTGYIVGFAFALVIVLLLMSVRLWFDMAQVRAVVEDERAIRRSCVQGFKLTVSNLGSLFWLYFRISFLGWVGLAIGLALWTRLSGGRTIVMLEVVLLWWLITRLWQRASEVAWYQQSVTLGAPVIAPATVFAPMPEPLPAPSATDSVRQDE